MKTVGKLITSVASLVVGIVIILLVLPSQLPQAQQANNQTEQLTSHLDGKILNYTGQTTINATVFNNLNNETENILNQCAHTTISNSTTCIHAINIIKQDCNGTPKPYLSYLPTCHDPRLQ
ncbi:MAG: hypothetical protein WAN47_00205 [Nitrosotalea sp.]